MARPGIVHLADLDSRYAWIARSLPPVLAAAGLVPEGEPMQRFAPPRVVVAIAPDDRPDVLERSRGWLALADHAIVVRDLAELPGALATALELARDLPERDPPPPPTLAQADLPPSSWVAFTYHSAWSAIEVIAAQLIDGHLLRLDSAGAAVDLAALPHALAIGDVFAPERTRDARSLDPGWRALGFDPVHPVAWRGNRMMFYWSYVAPGGRCFLSANDHDYPCGPAKKLLGHMDNDPVQVLLAPDLTACLWRFEHDATLTSAIPVRWQRAGAFDAATFPADPRRAVWFCQREHFDDPLDEDARDEAPAMVLGPDASARYALDLSRRVIRITGSNDEPTATHVGGPDEGFAVCDADHRIVRRRPGRLLGGWFRFATCEHDGLYWREDLATGARTPIAAADRTVCDDPDIEAIARDAMREGRHADAAAIRARHPSRTVEGELTVLAIPGTRNVLLVAGGFLRVV